MNTPIAYSRAWTHPHLQSAVQSCAVILLHRHQYYHATLGHVMETTQLFSKFFKQRWRALALNVIVTFSARQLLRLTLICFGKYSWCLFAERFCIQSDCIVGVPSSQTHIIVLAGGELLEGGLEAIRCSGVAQALLEAVNNNGAVVVGISAGAIILGQYCPRLRSGNEGASNQWYLVYFQLISPDL